MFSYYGSKSKLIHLYPKPKHNKIIEPFAGSARYALEYWQNDILLVDKYKTIVDVWHYLQNASAKDILSLPILKKKGDKLTNYNLSDIEKKFMGFCISCSDPTPRNMITDRLVFHRPKQLKYRLNFIARNLFKIKHWQIQKGSYKDIENQKATWFIDPPYQFGGECYKESNKNINYEELADWCKSRKGQVIVCESMQADWMKFVPLKRFRGNSNKHYTEAIWYNGFEKRFFDYRQKELGI